MTKPLSVAASAVGVTVVGVTVPTLDGKLLDDLRSITDAPKAVEMLKEGLLSVDMALKSIEAEGRR
jgi:hypothetical protein